MLLTLGFDVGDFGGADKGNFSMRAAVERVIRARVLIDGAEHSRIALGLLVYLGVENCDESGDVDCIVDKVRHLRVFPDEAGKMNRDVVEAGGQVLLISAFTVAADARKGRRPSFETAAPPDRARVLYERVCEDLIAAGLSVARGSFGAMMNVEAVNDGPICILLDTKKRI